ncbi:flagellar protein FlgN [Bacillus sp. ISL-45]|uniref:flagellar protein FlgN n=1 Tax=Bacillus sp. ISL-45 TaxID=2819128 RepID=UPI001BE5272B|nr:flagellar protein FlgN [Bacillus sp. ISL-45]MBT2661795.1 flagellar protein FlgN [Bacillus sp. ISL-45]
MSIHLLIESMQKLLKLHKSLLELSLKKTGILETEDIQALTQLLKEEQAHILAIEKIEAERMRAASDRKLNDLLEEIPEPEKGILEEISQELREVISSIHEQNKLNQSLISQSLKFITFSMSIVEPPQDDYNYGPNETGVPGKSLFSSKA